MFSLLPSACLVVFSLYIGIQLWKYGTYYSFMIHATYFNPWIWMVIGSVALAFGNLMPTPIYAISSNTGEVFMMACIMRMFREIHHDLFTGSQMQEFIGPTVLNHQTSQPRQIPVRIRTGRITSISSPNNRSGGRFFRTDQSESSDSYGNYGELQTPRVPAVAGNIEDQDNYTELATPRVVAVAGNILAHQDNYTELATPRALAAPDNTTDRDQYTKLETSPAAPVQVQVVDHVEIDIQTTNPSEIPS